ncbi:MAG TPA: hypothetical protein VMW16_08125 [Sedimentisphaerales bacterium]|nr:hypothetical protein [Sedimentisphaerales bacterium]
MDESKKKPIMIAVIVVCLGAAAVIAYKSTRRNEGIPAHFAKEMTWVKCRNPKCEAEYEITKKEYYEYLEKNTTPTMMSAPALICTKCGEPSVYRAVKCEKEDCGIVFEANWKRGDYEDRCPKCGHSQIERERKEAAAARRQGKK